MTTVLVTGLGGAGVSTVVAATALAARAGGGTPVVAGLDDDGSLGRLLEGSGVPVVDLVPHGWTGVDQAVADAVQRLGGEGAVAEEWRRLPGVDVLAALVGLASATPGASPFVVDLGDLGRAGDFLAAAVRLPWVLRRLLGMQPMAARELGPEFTPLLPGGLDDAEHALALVRSAGCRLDVVAGASRDWWRVRRRVPPLLLSGVTPGLVIGRPDAAGVAPWASDPAPFTPVLLPHGSAPHAPEGLAQLGADLAEATPAVPAVDPSRDLSRDGDLLTWTVRLPWIRAGDVTVARRGEDLLVAVAGREYLLPQPPAIRRCTPVRTRVDGLYLRVEARIDRTGWEDHG